MTTTFKYKFYALNETMPSWLSDGDQNFFYHNVERAMVFYSQAGGRSIDTAMDDFSFTNTVAMISAMNTWSNYLDIAFSTTVGTKSIEFGTWKPYYPSAGSATTFIENGNTGNYAVLLNLNTNSQFNSFNDTAQIGNWGGWSFMHEFIHIFTGQQDIGSSPDLRQTILYYPTRLANGDIDPTVKIPLTPGMTDIANLQVKYGASTVNSGDSSYTFTANSITLGLNASGQANAITGLDLTAANRTGYVLTIWDSAGNDTIDASGIGNVAVNITLEQEKFGSIGNTVVGIAKGAEIENAKGGDGDDILKGNDLANMLEGNAGDDYLYGGKGIDTLKGGADDDYLDGGWDGANDILEGGDGFDTYIIYAGEHETINDSDGKGRIRYIEADGKTVTLILGAFIQVGTTNEWKHTLSNGDVITFTHNSPWKLTMPDGSIIELGETFTDGNYSIKLGKEAAPPAQSTRDIIGDLKPVDFDLTSAGIQTQVDDLGNVIVTATAEANRADILYDSLGNDHIQGMGGDDKVYLFHGGDDWVQGGAGGDFIVGLNGTGKTLIEGNAGSDIVYGKTGDDSIYGGDQIDLALAISQGAAAIANTSKGDWLDGYTGDDLLVGTASADVLVGHAGDDILVGGGGDDTLYGDCFSVGVRAFRVANDNYWRKLA